MLDFEKVKKFYDYLIIDDDGWKDIRDDAPEEAKKAYEKFKKQEELWKKQGIKV